MVLANLLTTAIIVGMTAWITHIHLRLLEHSDAIKAAKERDKMRREEQENQAWTLQSKFEALAEERKELAMKVKQLETCVSALQPSPRNLLDHS